MYDLYIYIIILYHCSPYVVTLGSNELQTFLAATRFMCILYFRFVFNGK